MEFNFSYMFSLEQQAGIRVLDLCCNKLKMILKLTVVALLWTSYLHHGLLSHVALPV